MKLLSRLCAGLVPTTLLSLNAAPAPVDYRDMTPASLKAPRSPAGAPNVLIILWDDIGFSQFGCYGSPISTPNIDRLASEGVRYTDFHVAPVCSPTRAALLTGRNPHSVGVACIAEFANGQPNSVGGMRLDVPTLPECLRAIGYSTCAIGKWHLTPMSELNPAASSDYWPTGRGFDHFYGFTSGETNPWAPELFSDRQRIREPPRSSDGSPRHSEADLVDHALAYLADQRANAPDKPLFLYLSFSAGHAPHHVSGDRIRKWRGKFDQGWDAVRESVLARQKSLGLIPFGTPLPPRNPGVKAWSSLSPEERRLYARYYETFAAFVEHTDEQMGRVLDHLRRTGQMDNTLVILTSDNGASPEGGPEGMWNEIRLFTTDSQDRWTDGLPHLEELGNDRTYCTYPTGWSMAGCAPFRMTKGTAHEGGVRVPLIMRWPGHIPSGEIRGQFHHVVDLLPTVLESVGAKNLPETQAGALRPAPGVSMAYTWKDGSTPSRRGTQLTEIYGHRAIYHDGWKAVVFHPINQPFAEDKWELYDLHEDINETRDRASDRPEKLAELLRVWEREARENDVYPLDDRRGAREMQLPPGSPTQGARFEYLTPVSGVHKGAAPDLRGRSWSLRADLTLADTSRSGAILAFGGRFAGFACYASAGHLVFHYNYAGIHRVTIRSPDPLGAGAHTIGARFALQSDGGATVTLAVDGREVAEGHVHRILRNVTHETFDLGCDLYTPVTEDYASPAVFPGELRRVIIEAEPSQPPRSKN